MTFFKHNLYDYYICFHRASSEFRSVIVQYNDVICDGSEEHLVDCSLTNISSFSFSGRVLVVCRPEIIDYSGEYNSGNVLRVE